MNKTKQCWLWVACALMFGMGSAPALACIDGASATELAWANQWGPCRQDIILNIYNGWDLTDDSWDPAGKSDDCNMSLPFAKVISAVVLTSNGPHEQIGNFHDTVDYFREARSTGSPFHGDFYLRFIEQGDSPFSEATSETGRFLAEDRTDLHCPLFNLTNVSSDMVVNRASVLIHEAWHHWQYANGWDTSHITGPTGDCTASGASCDNFFFHDPNFPFSDGKVSEQIGMLNRQIVTNDIGVYFHSPYQVQVEFDSDIALWTDLIPFVDRLDAQNTANVRLQTQFVNGAPFFVGMPEPFPTFAFRQNP